MADPISSQHQEVTVGTSTTVTTVVPTDIQDCEPREVPTLHLKLRKPKTGRKVQWTTETVDNEYLNKKKSKCCCIYKKPKDFGESSSSDPDSDDECDHCKGHVESKKHDHQNDECTPTENGDTAATESEIIPRPPSGGDQPIKPEDSQLSNPPPR